MDKAAKASHKHYNACELWNFGILWRVIQIIELSLNDPMSLMDNYQVTLETLTLARSLTRFVKCSIYLHAYINFFAGN